MKVHLISRFKRREDAYFKNHEEFILKKNMVSLDRTLKLLLGLFTFFLICSPFLFKDWKPTPPFLGIIPFWGFYIWFRIHTQKHKCFSYRTVQGLCIAMYAMMLIELLSIDLYPRPDGIVVYFPIIIAVFPCYFILRFRMYLYLTTCMEVIFIFLCLQTQTGGEQTDNIFLTMVGAIMAIGSAWVLMEARMEDGVEKAELRLKNRKDSLTGVLNKATTAADIRQYLEHKPEGVISALFIIDIDNFKVFNDTYGHQFGDEVLARVGDLLRTVFRATDVTGRIGGDEFSVFIENVASQKLIENRCKKLQEACHEIRTPDGKGISCSIGVVLTESHDYEQIFSMADDAMYEAKSGGKGQFVCLSSKDLKLDETQNIMLVADGSETDRTILTSNFSELYEVVEAVNGEEVLSYLGQYCEKIGIVLLDVNMPGMGGFEVLKYMKLRNRYKNIPVIVISADEDIKIKALQLGARDMLMKPIDPEVIKQKVKHCMMR